MPLFSVITPIYNGEETLEECLNSVADQTFKDFELVIVNDGSTDDSQDLIQQWIGENLSVDVKLIEQENQGLGASRNNAIKQADGKFIAFLDCDDKWDVNKLKVLNELISSKPGLNFIYHPVKSFGLAGIEKRFSYQVTSANDLLLSGNPIVPSASCISSEIAKENSFSSDDRFHGAEDLLLWYSLIDNGIKPYYQNAYLTSYREEGGMSTRLEEHLSKVFNVYSFLLEQGKFDQSVFDQAVSRKYYEAARFHHKRKSFAKAEEFYLQSNFNSPKVLGLRFFNFLGLSL